MQQAYIFSYGSLMLKQEIERTLNRTLHAEDMQVATLQQHMRAWSAERENRTSDHKWLLQRHSGVFPDYIAYLNIEHSSQHEVQGVVFLVNEAELAAFDRREVGYQRLDVSQHVQTQQALHFPVYTYMDQEPQNMPEGADVALSFRYMNLIRQVCQKLDETSGNGFTNNYLHQTYLPNAYIENLDVVYFNEDFSQLFELRLDRQPMKMHIASFSSSQHIALTPSWLELWQVDTWSIFGDWRQRFALACTINLTSEMGKYLKNDPCMLVRLAFDYTHGATKNIQDCIRDMKTRGQK